MTNISRRTFVIMSAGGVLIPSTAGSNQSDFSDEQRSLRTMLTNVPLSDDASCVYLLEYTKLAHGARPHECYEAHQHCPHPSQPFQIAGD